ncbi:transmembrane protein 53-A-like [Lytechinus variegatus]|uniref:transmembrane protein 53-A-like n=1 Tax=Lytechinus variegatus TaxID=7654 RepID=UPI001BB2A568|nr:transmembrane protein 53-A-like [Lytechinus variegatus]
MEELEYHVIFPTNFSQGKSGVSDDASAVRKRTDMNTVPAIFLLGWYGCQDKHLAKYGSIYQSKGFITIRYILPHDYIFSRKKNAIRNVALKVLEAFFDLGLEENPIFFHAFSNGGGYVYRHLTEIVNGTSPGQNAKLKIVGIICDSMPSYPTATTAYRAMVSAMPPTQHWFIKFIKSLGIWIFFMVLSFISYIRRGVSDRDTYYKAMLADRMRCPQLFLYSKKDQIVPYKDIQGVIAERRRQGFDVQEVVWDDTDHVAHLRKHPQEYASACLKFVNYCLERVKQD